jgi:hypothetical protein
LKIGAAASTILFRVSSPLVINLLAPRPLGRFHHIVLSPSMLFGTKWSQHPDRMPLGDNEIEYSHSTYTVEEDSPSPGGFAKRESRRKDNANPGAGCNSDVWIPGMDSNQGSRYDACVGEL